MQKMEDRQWYQAYELLRTALKKDPMSPEARYAMAVYYASQANPAYDIDSARIWLQRSRDSYSVLTLREKEKLQRFPLDSTLISTLSAKISALAYRDAVTRNSIQALSDFLRNHPLSAEQPAALETRDSLAFEQARTAGTPEAYLKFTTDWPESPRKKIAAGRYEEGMFLRLTSSGKITDLRAFLQLFPHSPFRQTVVEKIFRMVTMPGTVEAFQTFAGEFPEDPLATVSRDLIQWRGFVPPAGRLLPYREKESYGFFNLDGRLMFKPTLEGLKPDDLCVAGDTGLVTLPSGVYDRGGRKLTDGQYQSAIHLGDGFLRLTDSLNTVLIHASGWRPLTSPVTDAFLISHRYLALNRGQGWGIRSINGVEILPETYDSIRHEGNLLILRRNNRNYLVPLETLPEFSKDQGEFMVADEVRMLKPGLFMVRTGDVQEVVDEKLRPVIEIAKHVITTTPFGFLVEQDGQYRLTGWSGLENKTFRSVSFRLPWMQALTRDSLFHFHVPSKTLAIASPDSTWFNRGFLFARKQDSTYVFTPDHKRITIGRDDITAFHTAGDSSLYFLVRKKKQLVLYDLSTGKRVIAGTYNDIIPVSRKYFLVNLRNKTGMVNARGKELLTADYDAVIYRNGWFSLLREGKFGGYQPESGRVLKAVYDANLVPLSDQYVMARKNQKWGLIGPASKPELVKFQYDEIAPLTDSLVMVRTTNTWNILSFHSGRNEATGITRWQLVSGADRIIFETGGKYGMMTPSAGKVVEATYDEITWWSDETHFLFAGIRRENDNRFILDYFDRHGLMLRRQPVTRDELDYFICED